ncbi:S-methyl-5'-thioadenosine phosphorylase [Myxococcota bacterium]|jgi:5'-methylthioadenosine phosphorylase|nr:S-methyl-5'-thioadenosine phosphorylase [Myxococcota bacterium]
MAARVGIIGGSGLYQMEGLRDLREVTVETPFGETSDAILEGVLEGVPVAFLSRHGRGHRWLPTEVPYRANLWALKSLGVERIFSVSAVGSMKEEVRLGVPVLVDQFIDRTVARKSTFFGEGVVAHVSMADPVCPALRGLLLDAARRSSIDVVPRGTYLCIEGPQFSSRGESLAYRQTGVDLIGMTNATEAKLAREAEICYATVAVPTDYDCWHESEEDVSVEAVIRRLEQGIGVAKTLIRGALARLDHAGPCRCGQALAGAVMTRPDRIPPQARRRLSLLLDRHLPPAEEVR